MNRGRAFRRAKVEQIKKPLKAKAEYYFKRDQERAKIWGWYTNYSPRTFEEILSSVYRNEGKPRKRVYHCCSTNCEWCINNFTYKNLYIFP